MSLISASIITCADVLTEKDSDLRSAIKLHSVITDPPRKVAHFYSLAILFGTPDDRLRHVLSMRMFAPDGSLAASAPNHLFTYGYRQDPAGYGEYNLSTEWDIDLTKLPSLGWFTVWAYLDDQAIAQAPIMLRLQH